MAELDTPKLVEEITHARTGPFAVNYHSDNFVGGALNAELIAAPTRTNSATYITHVTMGITIPTSTNYIADAELMLIDGIGDEMFGPVLLQSNGQSTFSKDFTKPMKVTDNKAVDISGSNAGAGSYQPACWVYVEYYTGDNPIT